MWMFRSRLFQVIFAASLIINIVVYNVAYAAWAAEETFDSYTNGNDLNGKNGGTGWAAAWVSGTANGVVLSNTTTYQGAEAAKATSASLGGDSAERQMSADVSGAFVMFVAMQRSSTSSGMERLDLRNTTDNDKLSIVFDTSGNILIRAVLLSTPTTQIIQAYSTNTWYVCRITGNTTTGTATGACSSGAFGTAGTFSAESTPVSFDTGALRYVLMDFNSSAGSGVTNYWDYISPTTPFTSPAAVDFGFFNVFWW